MDLASRTDPRVSLASSRGCGPQQHCAFLDSVEGGWRVHRMASAHTLHSGSALHLTAALWGNPIMN